VLELVLRNGQRTAKLEMRLLRRMVGSLLKQDLGLRRGALGVHLVDDRIITELNEKHLHHGGATDVITFNYLHRVDDPKTIAGDVFVCIPEALRQALRFRTTWQAEMARYILHGILHLRGHDDRTAPARRKMKREENRLLKLVSTRFNLQDLAGHRGQEASGRTITREEPAGQGG
jgi:probable rRNA maturation factor